MSARLRKLMLKFVLLGGALGGMAMRPEEIEELLSKMSETKIVLMAERQDTVGMTSRQCLVACRPSLGSPKPSDQNDRESWGS